MLNNLITTFKQKLLPSRDQAGNQSWIRRVIDTAKVEVSKRTLPQEERQLLKTWERDVAPRIVSASKSNVSTKAEQFDRMRGFNEDRQGRWVSYGLSRATGVVVRTDPPNTPVRKAKATEIFSLPPEQPKRLVVGIEHGPDSDRMINEIPEETMQVGYPAAHNYTQALIELHARNGKPLFVGLYGETPQGKTLHLTSQQRPWLLPWASRQFRLNQKQHPIKQHLDNALGAQNHPEVIQSASRQGETASRQALMKQQLLSAISAYHVAVSQDPREMARLAAKITRKPFVLFDNATASQLQSDLSALWGQRHQRSLLENGQVIVTGHATGVGPPGVQNDWHATVPDHSNQSVEVNIPQVLNHYFYRDTRCLVGSCSSINVGHWGDPSTNKPYRTSADYFAPSPTFVTTQTTPSFREDTTLSPSDVPKYLQEIGFYQDADGLIRPLQPSPDVVNNWQNQPFTPPKGVIVAVPRGKQGTIGQGIVRPGVHVDTSLATGIKMPRH